MDINPDRRENSDYIKTVEQQIGRAEMGEDT
jgi:Cu/Ag efflux pump CusA